MTTITQDKNMITISVTPGRLCKRCNTTTVAENGQCLKCGIWETPMAFLSQIDAWSKEDEPHSENALDERARSSASATPTKPL